MQMVRMGKVGKAIIAQQRRQRIASFFAWLVATVCLMATMFLVIDWTLDELCRDSYPRPDYVVLPNE